MCWLQGEPSLTDVLADPVVHAMMRRDKVDPERLRALLWRIGGTVAREAAARTRQVERRNAAIVFN
jgi:hypothetical protein